MTLANGRSIATHKAATTLAAARNIAHVSARWTLVGRSADSGILRMPGPAVGVIAR